MNELQTGLSKSKNEKKSMNNNVRKLNADLLKAKREKKGLNTKVRKLKAALSKAEMEEESLNTKFGALMKENEQLKNNKRQAWFESEKEGCLTVRSNSLILESKMTCKATGPRVEHGYLEDDEYKYWQDWMSF